MDRNIPEKICKKIHMYHMLELYLVKLATIFYSIPYTVQHEVSAINKQMFIIAYFNSCYVYLNLLLETLID